MEYCNGGDLKKDQARQMARTYSVDTTTRILADVLRGLEVIHESGYLHRDIKVDNILIHDDHNGNKVNKSIYLRDIKLLILVSARVKRKGKLCSAPATI